MEKREEHLFKGRKEKEKKTSLSRPGFLRRAPYTFRAELATLEKISFSFLLFFYLVF